MMRVVPSKKKLISKIHKIYLVIALLFGITFSIGMPFFNEPDGPYHYVMASNIMGLSNDVAQYGETYQWYGDQYQHQAPAYKDGNYFTKYYATKIKRISLNEMQRAGYIPSKLSYNYWGHLIPALGVWLGYHIYPSMGVMIVTGRLITMFVCTLAMYFIIKKLKRGKLLFTAVSLLPVTINIFSSLSYDATSFVLTALIIMTAINALVDPKISVSLFIRMVVLSLISIVVLKTNFLLLLLLFPIVLIHLWWKNRQWLKHTIINYVKERKRFFKPLNSIFIAIILCIIGFIAVKETASIGGFGRVVYRLIINQFYVFDTSYSTASSALVEPLGFNNSLMPTWTIGLWFVLLTFAAFSEDRYVKSRFVSYSALAIFLLNVVAVYVSYITYPVASNSAGIMGQIVGVQGRYFTPTLLLFAIYTSNSRLKINRQDTVIKATIVIAALTNAMLLFNTLFTIKYMG